jgi:hypothetical protein
LVLAHVHLPPVQTQYPTLAAPVLSEYPEQAIQAPAVQVFMPEVVVVPAGQAAVAAVTL